MLVIECTKMVLQNGSLFQRPLSYGPSPASTPLFQLAIKQCAYCMLGTEHVWRRDLPAGPARLIEKMADRSLLWMGVGAMGECIVVTIWREIDTFLLGQVCFAKP
jgi:hypothetical protein